MPSENFSKPKVVVLCGSSKFIDIHAVVAWILERDEGVITMGMHLLPTWYPNVPADHLAEHENCADRMDELHLRKIDLADEIFVIDWDHYYGTSTKREIDYATRNGKQVRFLLQEYNVCTTLSRLMAEAARQNLSK